MQIPSSLIDPACAEPDKFVYVVALKDDDWDHWDSLRQASKYNGARRSTGHWNLRDLVTGSPVAWSYADTDIVVLEVLN
ncbi:Uncharacterised protein [Mycobacteroides abscessus subsp. abscessus]|jgi:hypothetical protein|uniref:hypothetical protein n=1 Tax=Mycobacteroides abscessus TaxID=36809 RepID=UPI000929656A|nr:hypothetical protein [Mycobacteroides abscessus]SIH26170.1 Uncharacterised protein [Mycobacteroides abscessus subsp. abscessus]